MLTRPSLIVIALLGFLPYVSTIKLPPIASFWAEWIAAVLACCWLASLTKTRDAKTHEAGDFSNDGSRPAAVSSVLLVPVAVLAFAFLGAILLLQLVARQPLFRGAPALALLALVLASLVCIAGAKVRSSGQSARLLDAWSMALLAALLVNLAAVLGERQGWHVYIYELGSRPPPGRAEGLLGQPNQLAVFAALTSVAAHYLWMRSKLPSMAHGLFALMTALVISATGSRAGLLLWIAGAVLSALALRSHPRANVGFRLVLLAGALMLATQVALPLLDSAGTAVTAMRGETRGRLELWRDSWALVKLHPLAGVGYGNFMAARWNELSGSLFEPNANQAHNLIAQLAVELGSVGAVLVLLPLGVALWRCALLVTRRGVAPEQFLAASVALLLAGYSMVEYPLWYTFFLLPFALALGLIEQPDLALRVSPLPPGLRWAGFGLAGALYAVLAFDYHRSEELYSSLELQQRTGNGALVRIPLQEASEISALSAFDLYANLMYSRTLVPDGLFMGYKLDIAERAMSSMTNQETIGRKIALLVAAGDTSAAKTLLARTRRNPELEVLTRGVLKNLAPLNPALGSFVSGLPAVLPVGVGVREPLRP